MSFWDLPFFITLNVIIPSYEVIAQNQMSPTPLCQSYVN